MSLHCLRCAHFGCIRARQLLLTMHTYVYCVSEPPVPRAASSTPETMARWQLFRQLRPMFYGKHHLDEIAWQGTLDRAALTDLLKVYDRWVVKVSVFEM